MQSLRYNTLRARDISKIKSNIFENEWYTIYEFVEFILELENDVNIDQRECEKHFSSEINRILKDESAAYILSRRKFLQITSEQEIQSIEEALQNTHLYSGVQQHLNQALQLMSDRKNPDYRNSIKESVSALEGFCQKILNKDKVTLGDAIGQIEKQFPIHPALKSSIKSLYGYTSDGDGIRHAMMEESNLSYIDAKFMLVACTNFINYLIDKTKV